jgi:putative ABC transport system permease protein
MLRDDLFAALRHTLRRPSLSLAVALTLAVAIAAATTAVGLARAVLWRSLPFANASRLVFVWEDTGTDGDHRATRVTSFRYTQWTADLAQSSPFSSLALFGTAGFTLETPDGAQSIRGVRVSAGYFDTLAIAPILGRSFTAGDDKPGAARVAILSHRMWRERFGANPRAVGTSIRLSGEPYTVVGVMPPVVFPAWPVNPAVVTLDADAQELWVPIPRTAQLQQNSRAHVFGVLGRLRDGTTPQQARDALIRTTDRSAPDAHGALLSPLRDQLVRDARASLIALAGAALAVLLVACANLASLHVSAFERRRPEFSVRAAIGGSVGTLARQVALEALVPSVAGGLLGVAMARSALAALPRVLPSTVPLLTAPMLDAPLVLFAMALSLAASVMLTIWPIVRLVRATPAMRGTPGRPRRMVYRVLVVSQVALAIAVTTAASLLGRSLQFVEHQNPGFAIDRVLVADLGLPVSRPVDPRALIADERAVLSAVSAIPGAVAAATAYDNPLEANWSEIPTILGDERSIDERRQAELRIVSPGYFDALGVDILSGRGLTDRDDFDTAGIAVINEAFARELGGRVVGRKIRTATPRTAYGSAAPAEFEIVGVVRNERFRGLEAPALPAFYLSTRQFPQSGATILVRTTTDPMAIVSHVRISLRRLNSSITFSRPTSLSQILAEQLAARRSTTAVIGTFAIAALSLATLGIYGLLAVFVSVRTREIGVRLAIGASPRAVALGVFREGLVSAATGAAVGCLLALATGRLVSAMLVGTSSTEPTVLAVVVLVLLVVAGAAAWAPARRAASIDPVNALRAE